VLPNFVTGELGVPESVPGNVCIAHFARPVTVDVVIHKALWLLDDSPGD